MTREETISGLEKCAASECNEKCPYNGINYGCRPRLMLDAMAMLKEQEEQKNLILKVVWDVLHEGVSTDTVADQDWVYEQIRNRIEKTY